MFSGNISGWRHRMLQKTVPVRKSVFVNSMYDAHIRSRGATMFGGTKRLCPIFSEFCPKKEKSAKLL